MLRRIAFALAMAVGLGITTQSEAQAQSLDLNSSMSAMVSAMFRAYDGVASRTFEPKSCMIMICLFVWPPDIGITVAPSFSAP